MAQVAPSSPVSPERPLSPEDLQGDVIQSGHPLFGVIWINRHRMGGAPCFTGTRVPVQSLFDHLEGGISLDEFLDDFEGVTREQAEAVVAMAAEGLLERLPRA